MSLPLFCVKVSCPPARVHIMKEMACGDFYRAGKEVSKQEGEEEKDQLTDEEKRIQAEPEIVPFPNAPEKLLFVSAETRICLT